MKGRWALGVAAAVLVAGCSTNGQTGDEVQTESSSSAVGASGGPTAVLTGGPTSGAAPLAVELDGTTSRPAGDGSWVTTCKLEFGDGVSTSKCWGDHVYAAGTWTARFTVTDNLGRSASTTLVITAKGAGSADAGTPDAGTPGTGPRAVLTGGPTSGPAPLNVELDGTSSKPAGDGSWVTTCKLEFGDGTSTSNCWGDHVYAAGTWVARLTLTDNLGRTGVATLTLTAGGGSSGGGSDGGTDGGTPAPDGGTPDGGGGTPGGSAGWQFFGAGNGGPTRVHGVTSDASGNVWVAGGDEGLFLLEPGATRFRRFTVADGLTGYNDGTGVHGQPVLSVAGGPAGTVFVGYQGLPGCDDAFYRYNFRSDGSFVLDKAHEYIWKSGDADRVTLSGSGISVVHYDISSAPGTLKGEPYGREKICTVYRLAYDAGTQSVWFGGNHGVAWGDARSSSVWEHTHPAINGYVQSGSGYTYTLLTDLYFGISVMPNGDLWLGGAERSAKYRWASLGRDFWAADTEIQRIRVDVWPDAVPADSYPWQRVQDNVSDMAAVADGSVWIGSFTNGLAHWTPSGIEYRHLTSLNPTGNVAGLELDPLDGSLWVGFTWGGVSRVMSDGRVIDYGAPVLGDSAGGSVPDIQSDRFGGQRRILVAASGGGKPGVWIYTGP